MREKQQVLMDAFLTEIGEEYRMLFQELSEYAASLDYTPVRNKTNNSYKIQ